MGDFQKLKNEFDHMDSMVQRRKAREAVIPPMSRMLLEVFYLLVQNCYTNGVGGNLIPESGCMVTYEKFMEISPSLDSPENIRGVISRVRPALKRFGFYVLASYNAGYRCFKENKEL